ncbi:MAG: tRNA pseudouridine(38-40) synthase TruA, partial [Proteobacteria bacterium]|nr:tRNA pseudouridine(38-40) synthase TruA [Pseudomonadota bacterium]
HDFSAFRAAECQSRVPVRRLDRISVRRHGELVEFELTANAFLHHMVRNIVGSAIKVGEGARPPEWLAAVLAGRDRRAAGPTAPPGGLYFAAVDYPPEAGIPRRAPPGVSAMIGASALPEGPG